mgnify:CR=1 FL=1
MDKPVRCAVMGQHPMRFPWGFDEEDESCGKMKMELAQQIMVLRQNGVSQFLVPVTAAWGCTPLRSSTACGQRPTMT